MLNDKILLKYGNLRQELYAQFERYRERAERRGVGAVNPDAVHGTGISDTVGNMAVNIVDAELKYKKLLQEYNEIQQEINAIPDRLARSIIILKYGDGYAIKDICAVLNISRHTVRRKLIKWVK